MRFSKIWTTEIFNSHICLFFIVYRSNQFRTRIFLTHWDAYKKKMKKLAHPTQYLFYIFFYFSSIFLTLLAQGTKGPIILSRF